MSHLVLIVDDEPRLADVLAAAMESFGHRALTAANGEAALVILAREQIDLVLTDMRMPGMSGRDLLHAVTRDWPDVPVVLITAFTSVRDAVDIIKEGAFDYIAKPFDMEAVEAIVRRALRLNDAARDNERLREEVQGRFSFEQLIGTAPRFHRVIEQIAQVCESRATVLLTGESGTGKELVARAIHYNSPRRRGPYIAVNCAAVPEGMLESELFGHVKGAFAGAIASRKGRFVQANGGTLLLDEIAGVAPAIQLKLLRALQERTFDPVGSTQSQTADVRVIAASDSDIGKKVEAGAFREDLYYRLNVYPIALPALRERSEDVSLLAAHFLAEFSETLGKKIVAFTPAAQKAMAQYAWPGNIRELQNCVERAVIVASAATIDVPDLPAYLFGPQAGTGRRGADPAIPGDLDAELERLERDFVLAALEKSGGVQIRAAGLLGINERSLWHRIKKLKIEIRRTPVRARK